MIFVFILFLLDNDVDFIMSNEHKPHVKLLNILKFYSQNYNYDENFEKTNLVHSLLGAIRNLSIAGNLDLFIYQI